jgi:hypothetical protein
MAPRPLHPHERAFLEGYVKGSPAEQVQDQLEHDTRGAWSTSRGASGAVEVRHAGGSRARLVEAGGVITAVQWLDDEGAKGAGLGSTEPTSERPAEGTRGGGPAPARPSADTPEELKKKAIERMVADVAFGLGGSSGGARDLARAIAAADVGSRADYAPALAAFALDTLATRARELGDDGTRAALRGLQGALRAADDAALAGALRALARDASDAGLAAALEDTAHFVSLGGVYPAFPRRLLGHLGAPPWAALALAACALGASFTSLARGREAALYPLAHPSAGHGVVWLEGATLSLAQGSLEACLAALPPERRQGLLRAMPALRGARRGRITVPGAPRIEPACSLGRHAVVGGELWLSSPQGVVVRALPHLEHLRELVLPHRVDALAASADGRLVATLAREGVTSHRLTLLDASSGAVKLEREVALSGGSADVALSATGRFVVLSGSVSSLVFELDAELEDERGALAAEPRRFGAPALVLPDERSIVHASAHELSRTLLDRPAGEPSATQRLLATGSFSSALACSADGATLAIAYRRKSGEACRVELVTLATLARRLCFSQRADVAGLAFSPHGELAAVDYHGELRLVDARGRVRRHLWAGPGRVTFAGADLLVSGWARPTVLDAASGLALASFGEPPGGASRVEHLAFAGDVLFTETGRHLRERTRRSWDLDSGLQLGPPPTIERAFLDPRESPDGAFRVEAYETGRHMVMGDSEPVLGGLAIVPLGRADTEAISGVYEPSTPLRVAEHPGELVHLAVSRCSGWILSVGGGQARVTHATTRESRLVGRGLGVFHASFDAEHRGVALVGRRGDGATVARLVTFDDQVLVEWRGPAARAEGHVGARVLVAALGPDDGGRDHVPGTATLVVIRPEGVEHDVFHRAELTELVVSPSGERLAAVDRDGVVRVRAL